MYVSSINCRCHWYHSSVHTDIVLFTLISTFSSHRLSSIYTDIIGQEHTDIIVQDHTDIIGQDHTDIIVQVTLILLFRSQWYDYDCWDHTDITGQVTLM